MTINGFDELNTPKVQVEEPEEYFKKMDISPKQRKERVETSKELADVMLFLFALLAIEMQANKPNYPSVLRSFKQRFHDVVSRHSRVDDYVENYINEFTGGVFDTTRKYMEAAGVGMNGRTDAGWWTSTDRATAIGENEANSILNYEELQQAADEGYTTKEWITERDNRVRPTHKEVDGVTIGINEYFIVGGGMMLAPHDEYNNPEECPNCRCALRFGQKRAAVKEENTDIAEESKRPKKDEEYYVDWNTVKSKEYTNRFSALSDNEKANNAAASYARRALTNRDTKNTEELYAIDMNRGTLVSKITNQNIPFGVNRTPKFVADANRAEENGASLLFIHNHPNNTAPSYTDVNELLGHANAVGITVGHKGSIYYYTKPNQIITKRDYAIAKDHFKMYTNEDVRHEKAMELLAARFGFEIKAL